MTSTGGRLRIIFNGEIYNYIELRKELEARGTVFRTRSDTEVLLAAFEAWGEAALPRLNGMFAFVLWDEESRRLLIARDRFGEKPLFIGRGRLGTVIVASEMKAILTHPLMPCSPSARSIQRYAEGSWYEDDAATFFEGIERLPPAHATWLREDGAEERRWRYWTPDYNSVDDSLRAHDAVDQFADLFRRSIRMRLRADVPVGSSLSGGLDSSAIVGCLATERVGATFTQNTFSACFPADPTISEDQQVEAVVRHTDVNSFRVEPEPKRLMAESALLHWHQEEPFLSASIYLQWCVARLAKENNTTVILDGQGADELLGGYQYYFRQRQLDLLDTGRVSLARRETAKFNRRLQAASRNYEGSQRRFDAKIAYSEVELAKLAKAPPPVSHYPYDVGTAPAIRGYRLRRTISEALLYNSLPMLLRYADRNAMAFSRETRLPFLDYDLVDFCLRVPDDFLVRNGWQKWLLRAAVGTSVPASIRWRADKVGYAAPLDLWLRGELKEWAQERAFYRPLNEIPGYSAAGVASLWEQHQSGKANHSWALWRWISLAEWLHLLQAGWWRAGAVGAAAVD